MVDIVESEEVPVGPKKEDIDLNSGSVPARLRGDSRLSLYAMSRSPFCLGIYIYYNHVLQLSHNDVLTVDPSDQGAAQASPQHTTTHACTASVGVPGQQGRSFSITTCIVPKVARLTCNRRQWYNSNNYLISCGNEHVEYGHFRSDHAGPGNDIRDDSVQPRVRLVLHTERERRISAPPCILDFYNSRLYSTTRHSCIVTSNSVRIEPGYLLTRREKEIKQKRITLAI